MNKLTDKKSFLDIFNFHLFRLDVKGIITECHIQGNMASFGVENEMVGSCLYSYKCMKGIEPMVKACLTDQTDQSFQYEVVEGQMKHLFKATLKPDTGGVVMMSEEVSESREQATKEESKYNQLLSSILDVYFRTDAKGEIIEISPSIEQELGFKGEEIIGKQITDFIPYTVDLNTAEKKLIKYGRVEAKVVEVQNAIGETSYVSVTLEATLNKKGQFEGVIGMFRNVTKRIQAEVKERESYLNFVDVINSSLDGMIIIDAKDGRIIDSNEAMESILDYSMDEKTIFQISAGTKEEVDNCINEILAEGDLRFEFTLKKMNGDLVETEMTAKMMQVGGGRLFQCTVRDTTDEKRRIRVESFKKDILRKVVSGEDTLPDLISNICITFEEIFKGSYCSYYRYESSTQTLHLTSGESLPSNYLKKIKKIKVGKKMGSSGRAVFFKKMAITPNIQEDENWEPFWKITKSIGFESCWSVPLLSSNNQVLGTFTIYYKVPKSPSLEELSLIDRMANVMGLAIGKIKNQRELISSENRYRQLVDNSPLAIVIHRDGLIVFVNDEAIKILNAKNSTELVGQPMINFVQKSHQEDLLERIKSIKEKQTVSAREEKLIALNGAEIIVQSKATLVEYEGKEVVQAAFYDITSRKKAEQNLLNSQIILKQREELLNKTGEIAKVGGWELDLKEMSFTGTDQSYHLHELEVGNGLSLENGIDFYHPDDRPLIRAALDNCIQNGIAYNLELRFITAKGKKLWLEAAGQPVIENNKVVKLIGTIRDVTEYKAQQQAMEESEEKLKNANQIAELGHWDWDIRNDKVYWSDELYPIYGVTKNTEPTMDFFEQILNPDSKKVYYDLLKKALKETSPTSSDLIVTRPDSGESRHISVRIITNVNEEGVVLRMFGTVQDITDRIKLEKQVNQANLRNQVLLELGVMGSVANNNWFLVNEYCKALVQRLGHDWVWIAEADGLSKGEIKPMASYINPNCECAKRVSDLLENEKNGLSLKVIELGEVRVVEDFKKLKGHKKWSSFMQKAGFTSFISLPYFEDNSIKGTVNIYSKQRIVFDEEIMNFYNQFAYDLGKNSSSLALKKHRDELNEFNKLLLDSLHVISISADMHNGLVSIFGETEALLGFDKEESLDLLKRYEEVVHPSSLSKIKNDLKMSKEKGGYFDLDIRIKNKSGRYVWLNSIGKVYWKRNMIRKIVGIVININEKKNQEANEVKAQVLGRDNERRRIAREIHDSLGQTLTVASMSMGALSKDILQLSKDRQEIFQEAYDMVNAAIDESRGISHALMPSALIDFGLVPSIESDIARMNRSTQIKFNFFHHSMDKRFDSEIEANIYNITREAISNIVKHSKATSADIQLLNLDKTLVLSIEDNGIGFDKSNLGKDIGIGLSNIKSRVISINGELFVESEKGTHITVEVDLE